MQRKPKVALDHRSGDLGGALSSVPNGQCCGYSSILWATNAHNPDIDNLFYMPYPQKMLFQGSLIFSPEQCPRPTVIFTILCWYLKSLGTSLRGGVGCVCYLEKKSSFWAPFLKYWGQGWTLDMFDSFPGCYSPLRLAATLACPQSQCERFKGHQEVFLYLPNSSPPCSENSWGSLN